MILLGRVETNAKKGQKSEKKIFFFVLEKISRCDTCFHFHFVRTFQNIVFRFVALVKGYGMEDVVSVSK